MSQAYESIFTTLDDRDIQWLYKSPEDARYLAIVSTDLGQTNDFSTLDEWISYLSENEAWAVLMYNYPGVGNTSARSPGFSQSKQMAIDLSEVIQIARRLHWKPHDTFLIGVSIGTGPVLQRLNSITAPHFGGIVLFSPYSRLHDIHGIDTELERFFECPKQECDLEPINSATQMAHSKRAAQHITIVVGTRNKMIDPMIGKRFYDLFKGDTHFVRLIRVKKAPHAAVSTAAQDFVREIIGDPSAVKEGAYDITFERTLKRRNWQDMIHPLDWMEFMRHQLQRIHGWEAIVMLSIVYVFPGLYYTA